VSILTPVVLCFGISWWLTTNFFFGSVVSYGLRSSVCACGPRMTVDLLYGTASFRQVTEDVFFFLGGGGLGVAFFK